MLTRRKQYFFAITAVYVVLLFLFFNELDDRNTEPCPHFGTNCVRFCCKDEEICRNSTVLESFAGKFRFIARHNYNPIFEKPSCLLKPAGDRAWRFTWVSFCTSSMNIILIIFLWQKTGILIENFELDQNEYCFEESNDESGLNWNLLVCLNHHYFRMYFALACKLWRMTR